MKNKSVKLAGLFALAVMAICSFWGCTFFGAVGQEIVDEALSSLAEVSAAPTYSYTATLILVDENENSDEFDLNGFANDYNEKQKLIEDILKILKSRDVLDAAGEALGISDGYEALKDSVAITNPEDTVVIHVTAMADSPEAARQIVDNVCIYGQAAVRDIYNLELRVFE